MANNWITRRAQRTGGPLHSRKGAKAKGPLRVIIGVLRYGSGMFDTSSVELECGHRAQSYNTSPLAGTSKARCAECGKGDERYAS